MATVLTCYYRPKPGGLCTRLKRAMEALLERGHELHYVAVAPFPITHPRCHFHRFPWPARKAKGPMFWVTFAAVLPFQLLFIAIRHRATHLFAFDCLYAVAMRPAMGLRDIPMTLFIRGDVVAHHKLKGHGSFFILVERVLEGVAMVNARIHCVSSVLAEKVLARHRYLRPGLIGTLPNDIPSHAKSDQAAITTIVRVACVGILERLKNQAVVIESLRRLDTSQFCLKIFGTGPEEARLRSLAHEFGVSDQVSFMGWSKPDEMWPQIDLLAFPSLHEGAPNAILEALGHDIAILASDIPEHAEILPPACLVPNEPVAWAAKFKEILTDPERALTALRTEQKRYSERLHFDWDTAIVERIVG